MTKLISEANRGRRRPPIMAAIKPIDQSATKWQQRAAVAGPAYLQGVQNPKTPWAAAAAAAESNYGAGVTAAVSAKRYAEGVSLAVGTWTAAFQPYQSAIASLNLPPRGPTGAAQNLQRVSAVDSALHNLKVKA
jgi:hypothetical protein